MKSSTDYNINNKKNSLLKRMPGHNIALSKEWVSHENKYHMSHGIMNAGNKKQIGRMISQDLNAADTRALTTLPYMVPINHVGNEEVYSICITQGSSLKGSIRVNGSIKNSSIPMTSIYCKSVLDRFGESGHDLRSATEGIVGFYDCWDSVKDSCDDKNNLVVNKNLASEKTITLGEDKCVKQVLIRTNTYMVGKDDHTLGSIRVKKMNVFMNNNLIHETLFIQKRMDDEQKKINQSYTITTNLVKANTSDVIASSKNKDLARVLTNGDMIRGSMIIGLPYNILSYGVIDYNQDAINTMASDIKLNAKVNGPNERLEACVEALKSDVDNMAHMRVILDNALTKMYLIQGDKHDLFKIDSVVVLP